MTLRWHETPLLDPGAFHDHERTILAGASAADVALGFARLAPCAMVGAFDDPDRSLRRSFVAGHLPIIRRRTGGGSLYIDPGTTLMVTAIPRALVPRYTLTMIIELVGKLIAATLREQGIPATFTAPNDITDDGRKRACVFAVFVDDRILIEAALLFAVDIESLMKTIKLPLEKLSATGLLAAAQRFAPIGGTEPSAVAARTYPAIAAALATRLAMDMTIQAPPVVRIEPPSPCGRSLSPDVSAFLKTPGGVLHLDIALDGESVRAARIVGGVQCAAATDLEQLANALTGVRLDELEAAVLAAAPSDTLGFDRRDLGYLARLCVERQALGERLGIPGDAQRVTLYSPRRDQGFADLLADVGALLLPYCAKPAWCKWRHRDGCPECGQCAVGEAYRLGRAHGLPVTTITRYEHLYMVLEELRGAGIRTFLGVCCTEFFLKRDYAFVEAGLGALFIDIGGDTCYTLRAEESAYRGQFTAEATLDPQLLDRVLRLATRVTHLSRTNSPS
ncbi:MAG: lipoate--protein ligase family protein [Acidiferrobacter sp.]